MTAINPITFTINSAVGGIVSQINHVSRNIDKLMTQLISTKAGTDGDGNNPEQQKIESQVRQLEIEKTQLEHRRDNAITQQKQQERCEIGKSESRKSIASGRQTDIYV